jgi:hypothetical protein
VQLQVKFSRKICLDLPKVNDFGGHDFGGHDFGGHDDFGGRSITSLRLLRVQVM